MVSDAIEFEVWGEAVPKRDGKPGPMMKTKSGKPFRMRRPDPTVVEWQQRIAREAQAAGVPYWEKGPVGISIDFWFARPAARRRGSQWKPTRSDADRLTTCVFDALEGVAVKRDAQFAELHTTKRYLDVDDPDGRPRAVIRLWQLPAVKEEK